MPKGPENRGAEVIAFEFRVVHAPLPTDYTEIDDVVAASEKNEKRAKALAQARARLAERLEDVAPATLASLRMRSGLSQASLAEKIGNSQPGYSKIESGNNDILHSTFEKLVEILGVSRDELAAAIKNTRNMAKKSL